MYSELQYKRLIYNWLMPSVIGFAFCMLCSGCTFCGFGIPAAEAPRPLCPDRLHLSFTWLPGGGSERFDVRSCSLVYERESPRGEVEKQIVVPTDSQWESFWVAMDDIRLWEWDAKYNNPYVLDGGAYSLSVCLDNREVKSRGSNAGPVIIDGRLQATDEWSPLVREFRSHLLELIETAPSVDASQ